MPVRRINNNIPASHCEPSHPQPAAEQLIRDPFWNIFKAAGAAVFRFELEVGGGPTPRGVSVGGLIFDWVRFLIVCSRVA